MKFRIRACSSARGHFFWAQTFGHFFTTPWPICGVLVLFCFVLYRKVAEALSTALQEEAKGEEGILKLVRESNVFCRLAVRVCRCEYKTQPRKHQIIYISAICDDDWWWLLSYKLHNYAYIIIIYYHDICDWWNQENFMLPGKRTRYTWTAGQSRMAICGKCVQFW